MSQAARLRSDVAWESGFLALSGPDHVLTLDDFAPGAAGPAALSPLAITAPFRILGGTGVAHLQRICAELEQHSGSDERIARRARDGVYRSAFLKGLATDPVLISFLGRIAGASIEPHPISRQAIHVNYAPLGTKREVVDQGWHWEGVSFDYVMMVSRVLHRVESLAEPYPRISLIGSFYTYDPRVPDPQERTGPLYDSDPAAAAITEWSRFSAVAATRKLWPARDVNAAFGLDLGSLRQLIAESEALLTRALHEINAYERHRDGRGRDGGDSEARLRTPNPTARSRSGGN